MENKKVIRIIAGNPPSDSERVEEWIKWLDEVHVPRIFKFKKMKKITNFKLIDEAESEYTTGAEYPPYITIFELESREDWEEWMTSPEHFTARNGGLEKWGPNIGYKKTWYALYQAVKTWER